VAAGAVGTTGWPKGRVVLRIGLLAISVVMLAGLSMSLSQEQRAGYDELVQRFEVRAEVTARFLGSYVQEIVARERAVAEASLAGATVSAEAFRSAAVLFGFPAAVLLDERGVALATVPAGGPLIGQNLAERYDHLRLAVAGQVAVSGIVPSAVEAEPVVGFAVPYRSAGGRRVFSGALSVAGTSIGKAYLSDIAPLAGARAYLVDADAGTIATSVRGRPGPDVLRRHDEELHRAIQSRTGGSFAIGNRVHRFTTAAIEGTPWRLVIAVPEAALFAPLNGLQRWLPWALLTAMLLAGGLVLALLTALARSQRRQLGDLGQMSLTDPLTGLYNPRGFDLLGGQALRLAARERTPLTVVFLDVDGLKTINDTRGHAAGNEAIILTATVLREVLRDSDVIARVGGDEFCVVGRAGADGDAERLLDRVGAKLAQAAAQHGITLTVSAGISRYDPASPRSLEELVRDADARMYEHKHASGRDR
jgi:diguanylate cyclase (GGDEF)-like protein